MVGLYDALAASLKKIEDYANGKSSKYSKLLVLFGSKPTYALVAQQLYQQLADLTMPGRDEIIRAAQAYQILAGLKTIFKSDTTSTFPLLVNATLAALQKHCEAEEMWESVLKMATKKASFSTPRYHQVTTTLSQSAKSLDYKDERDKLEAILFKLPLSP